MAYFTDIPKTLILFNYSVPSGLWPLYARYLRYARAVAPRPRRMAAI
jgi:hypothetical protein